MKSVFLLFVLAVYTHAVTITSHNIYKQDDSVDLMLSFDEPYLGKISKKEDENSTILMLEGLKLDKSITRKINSKILEQIQILPYKNQIFIKVEAKSPYTLGASKTVDNFGLRIRIKQKPKTQIGIQTKEFKTKKETDISGSFLKVIAVLGFLFLLLYLLKRWITQRGTSSSNWLFHKDPDKKQDIKVLNQKVLDAKNRVALLEFNDTNYLVILGNSNIILDKFKRDFADNEQKFDTLLNQNSQKLDELLHPKD